MRYIILDLEMNRIADRYRMERQVCKMEVIEIGAVVLNEAYQEIGSFKTLVKPRYNDVIEKKYEKLTGISTRMVKDAPDFERALHMFFGWCESMEDHVEIYQWSNSDQRQIIKEMELKQISLTETEQKYFTVWNDFQKEFGDKLGLSNQVSLKNAVMYAGIKIDGYFHDALYDARNTATLFRTARDPEICRKALDRVIRVLKPEPVKATLGELFDFGSLGITA